jgi:predicted RecB family endonuclease
MSKAVDDYMAAMVIRDAAEEKVNSVIERLNRSTERLIEDWRDCRDMVTDEKPLTKSMPSPDEIQTAMTKYFEADSIAFDRWHALSAQEQRHLVPPDES